MKNIAFPLLFFTGISITESDGIRLKLPFTMYIDSFYTYDFFIDNHNDPNRIGFVSGR